MTRDIKYIIGLLGKLFGRKSIKYSAPYLTEEELAEETRRILSQPNRIPIPYTEAEIMSLPEKVRDVVAGPAWREVYKSNPCEKEH